MFHLPDSYIPAYIVETFIMESVNTPGVLSATGEDMFAEHGYSYVISALDGSVLLRKDLMAEQSYTYRVFADPATLIPYDTPAGNGVHPKDTATPNGAQYPFVAQQDVTLQSFPFSTNDPWLTGVGATETNGNNVDAFLNLFSPDGLGNPIITTPVDPITGDFRAQRTAAQQFLHSQTAGGVTYTAEARQASIQQLFYNVNFLHDWFYDSGFNEASGNAQTDNYGRGGLAADNIKAQVDDFAGFSNANMQTPADGGRPRMRMYVFPSIENSLEIQSPAGIAAKRSLGISMSGPQSYDVTGELLRATFVSGTCNVTNAAALAGKVAFFDFDNTDGTGCSFSTRITRITAQTTATAIVMAYTAAVPNSVANITGFVTANNKPMAVISWNSAAPIKIELAVPNVVNVRVNRVPDRDGSLDNQIVSHEWGHYISNRLVGNSLGLVTNNSGGLGEGWGDFTSMLLTVRQNDTATATNATWNGAYAMATYATSGTDANGTGNNGYYFGIRRMPYSTDMAINNLTFRHTANGQTIPAGPPIAFGADGANNSEVHNTGEVWANMMWECYASILRDTQGSSPRLTFDQAQKRMRDYTVAAYKATPNAPTLLEARDALLSSILANSTQDFVGCSEAFAKRGAGTRAVAPDRYSATNVGVVESYNGGADIQFVSAVLDDSVVSIDNDGYLDSGETGNLTITIRNPGSTALAATTSQITSSNPGLSFPNGNSVNFPTVQPLATSAITIRVHSLNQTGLQQTEFTITSNDPSRSEGTNLIPSPVAGTYREYTNADVIQSATDTVEARPSSWTVSSNPLFSTANANKFGRRNTTMPIDYEWFVPDPATGSDQSLTSPVMTVDGSGSVNLQFDHAWNFEFGGAQFFDGAVVEMSVNGGAFTDVGTGYTGTILNQGAAVQPLSGRSGYVGTGSAHTSITQAIAPGSTVQFRFRFASDTAVGTNGGWIIDNMAVTGIAGAPFNVLGPELAPTAAGVSVGGRVTTTTGQGLPRVTVLLTGANGTTVSTATNSFGYYRFDDVAAGQSYTLQASAKRFRFTPRTISVFGELTDMDITPNQ